MDYRIILTISKRSISFEYCLKGGKEGVTFFPGFSSPVPLAFYASPGGIVIGEEAVRAYDKGNEQAFIDYFDRLSTGAKFNFGGESHDIYFLLLYAAEEQFRKFFREVLFNNRGSLDDNRSMMPLTIVYESDINDPIRRYLMSVFSQSGYSNVQLIAYENFIREYLLKNYSFDNFAVAWSNGRDFFMSLFDRKRIKKTDGITIEGLGRDPRVEKVSEMIWEDVKSLCCFTSYDTEKWRLIDAAEKFLRSNRPEVTDCITLSDGTEADYYLNRYTINSIQTPDFEKLRNAVNGLLALSEVAADKRMLLLRGSLVGNDYFRQTLGKGFRIVKEADPEMSKDVKELIAVLPVPEPGITERQQPPAYTPPTPRNESKQEEQTPVKETASIPAGDIVTGKQESEKQKPEPHQEPSFDFKQVRELLANASGAMRENLVEKAAGFKDRLDSIIAGATLPDKLQRKLDDLNKALDEKTKKKAKTFSDNNRNVKERATRISDKASALSGNASEKESGTNENRKAENQKQKTDKASVPPEGLRLLKAEQFREARKVFTDAGDRKTAEDCSELFRLSRAVKVREKGIDICARTHNKRQADDAIREINAYIALRTRHGLPTDSQEALLRRYMAVK